MRRAPALLALLLVVTTFVACSTSQADPVQSEPSMLMVSIEGNSVEPSGARVDVAVGQPVELVVKSDVSGEIHVHTEPEEEIAFEPGTTSRTITIERPGLVDVERHHPDALIVTLEAR